MIYLKKVAIIKKKHLFWQRKMAHISQCSRFIYLLHCNKCNKIFNYLSFQKHKYYTRKHVSSYKNKKSNHILNARKIYDIQNITPNKELAQKTGCKISALKQIVKKGEGAYYSSGSRPNQTPQSWGLARLASSITSGKAAAVDYDILKKGCNH